MTAAAAVRRAHRHVGAGRAAHELAGRARARAGRARLSGRARVSARAAVRVARRHVHTGTAAEHAARAARGIDAAGVGLRAPARVDPRVGVRASVTRDDARVHQGGSVVVDRLVAATATDGRKNENSRK